MAPRQTSLPDTISDGGKDFQKTVRTLHRVVVNQRPDENCCKIKEVIKRGRKVGKVIRLREAAVMKYVKDKKEPSSSPAPPRVNDVVSVNNEEGLTNSVESLNEDVGVHNSTTFNINMYCAIL